MNISNLKNKFDISKLYLIVLIFFTNSTSASSQTNKFSLNLQYVPNLSKLTDEFVDEKLKLSHLGILKIEYQINNKVSPTIGVGYLNTGEMEKSDFNGQFGMSNIKFKQNHNYLIIPIGVNLYFSKIFLHPEIGVGSSSMLNVQISK